MRAFLGLMQGALTAYTCKKHKRFTEEGISPGLESWVRFPRGDPETRDSEAFTLAVIPGSATRGRRKEQEASTDVFTEQAASKGNRGSLQKYARCI